MDRLNAIATEKNRPLPRGVAVFLVHQLLSTIGTMIGTAVITFTLIALLHQWWPELTNKTASFILTGSPYFPMQVFFGFLLGWALMKRFGNQASLWVWCIPALVLIVAMIHGPMLRFDTSQPYRAVNYFLSSGCRAQDRCLDQIIVTLPFLTATAYSMGAGVAAFLKGNQF